MNNRERRLQTGTHSYQELSFTFIIKAPPPPSELVGQKTNHQCGLWPPGVAPHRGALWRAVADFSVYIPGLHNNRMLERLEAKGWRRQAGMLEQLGGGCRV